MSKVTYFPLFKLAVEVNDFDQPVLYTFPASVWAAAPHLALFVFIVCQTSSWNADLRDA